MSRPRWIASLVFASLIAAGASASAKTDITLYVSGAAGAQAQKVTLDVAGSESYDGTGGVTLYGADVGLGFPRGFFVDAHYFRHSNEFVSESTVGSYDARVDLAGDEWGGSLEWQLNLMPGSTLTPFLGVGGSYSRLTLDGEIQLRGASAPVVNEVDIYRVYGVAGLRLSRFLRATVQGGMSFGVQDTESTSYSLDGETVSASLDYDGYFFAASLSLGL